MHRPPPVQGLRQKAAIGAVETMEEKMRVLTLNELMRLTRIELCALAAQITAALPTFREGSPAVARQGRAQASERRGGSEGMAERPP
jgi:hypothetical protein